MPTVLLTGITGFLGGHVALALLDAGYQVRGSLRSLASAPKVRQALAGADLTRLELVELDLLSDRNWAEAAVGCQYLQHVASPFVIETPRDPQTLILPAVDGTRRAIAAALAAGMERLVVTSSVAAITYGHAARKTPFSAADWTNLTAPDVSPYAQSKTLAEQEAWRLVDAAGARDRLAVINPAVILGPLLDDDPGTSGELVRHLLAGHVPATPRLSFSIVDVRDVAAAQVAAMTDPAAAGRRTILAERELTMLEVANILRAAYPNHRLPRFTLPDWPIRLAALVSKSARAAAAELGASRPLDGSAGPTLLRRPLIPAADAIRAMADSLIAHGLVRQRP